MKRWLWLAAICLLLLSAVSCRKKETAEETSSPEEKAQGWYFLAEIRREGRAEEPQEASLLLNEEREAVLRFGGTRREGSWKLQGNRLVLSMGERFSGTLEGKEIRITIDGADCLFIRGRKAAKAYKAEHPVPFEAEESTAEPETETETVRETEPETVPETTAEPETEPVTAEKTKTETETAAEPETEAETRESLPESSSESVYTPFAEELARWNGTWFGYLAVGEADGAYTLLGNKNYAVYAWLDLQADGSGRYRLSNPFGFPFSAYDYLMEGNCRLTAEGIALLDSTLLGMPVNLNGWLIRPGEEGKPYGFTEKLIGREGSAGCELGLRKWGEHWPESEQGKIPGYADYEAAIRAETQTAAP
ncbi:MAG: hypothetical protein II882_03170 [Lachnospiraceae bacterium]|nr:hypothetical protein [Lachnospiraceae bacterium]